MRLMKTSPKTPDYMMNKIKIKLAEIPIEVQSKTDFMPSFCRDYLCDDEPIFAVSTTKEAVAAEVENAPEPTTYEYAEALCLYREMAERLPLYDRMVFHGAAIEYNNKAYLFTAPSGTGKTTHIALWRKFLGEKVNIINGDKPILRLTENGFTVYGTPYAGKEGWQRNVSAPLSGICILSQGKDNRIEKIENGDFIKLFQQTYKPHDKEAMQKTVSLVKELCRVPCFAFSCDISENAVKASFEALTNSEYEVAK